jgi:hypothetical protein
MHKSLYIPFLLLSMMAAAHAGDFLVERPGTFKSDDKKTAVEVATTANGHISFRLDCTIHTEVPDIGENVEVTSSRTMDSVPVKRGQWAYCVTKDGHVWFYDGDIFTYYRRLPDRIAMLQSCTEPTLGDRAPALLKDWIAKKRAEQDESPNLDSAVAPSK